MIPAEKILPKNKEEIMSDNPKYVAGINDELWRLPKILEKVGVSKSLWWKWVQQGIAPQGIKLTTRATAWRASEVQALIEKLAAGPS